MRQSGPPETSGSVYFWLSGLRGEGIRVGWHWHPITPRTAPTTKNDESKKATVPRSRNPALYLHLHLLPSPPQKHTQGNIPLELLCGTRQGAVCLGWTSYWSSRDWHPSLPHTWHIGPSHTFPTALSESLSASLVSAIKPRAQQPNRPHPHRCPWSTVESALHR